MCLRWLRRVRPPSPAGQVRQPSGKGGRGVRPTPLVGIPRALLTYDLAPLLTGFLAELGVEAAIAARIVQAVLRHRHRRGLDPEALEDKCLYDADQLDSIGAVGVARAYLWLGEFGRSVYYPESEWIGIDPSDNSTSVDSAQREWSIKLSRLKERMTTATGRELAVERHERMEKFLADLEREVKGEL